ncbi:pyridoxamine 5'-phosphate oxidase [Stackebrandtia soli]|uniref:pyridoxamine 5'-phosphate oxidase n=1 Tax=Stackebrandtia soli TaxID=1892856 RepID=UPI0039EA8FEE
MSGSDSAFDPWRLRRDYEGPAFEEMTLEPDPMAQFRRWFDESVRGGIPEPNAMVLATVDTDGAPHQRTVLLKGFEESGFEFYTNYESAKGLQLARNPHVSLLFGWYRLHRQVIVTGTAEKVDRARTERYFARRPRGAQLAAWASRQSRPIGSRDDLDVAYADADRRFAGGQVPPPPHWGGYLVTPTAVEFWQGRANRLHDRLRYARKQSGQWELERLSP